MDWQGMFVPTNSLGEIVLRGTIRYLALFFALRFLMTRHAGEVGIADILVIVLISEAAQNALVGTAHSITEALVLVGTILFWSFSINWLSHRFPLVARVTSPPARPLVRHGQLLRRNMRRELITEEELMSQLRQQGADDVAKVKSACLEGDGNISVVREDAGEVQGSRSKLKAG